MSLLFATNADGLHHGFRGLAAQVDVQEPVFQMGASHFDPVGQNEAALEGAGRDTAVQVDAFAHLLGLPTADDKLAVLDRDGKIILSKAGDGQSYAIGIFRGRLDIEGWIAFGGGFRGPLDQAFQLLEPKKEGMGAKGQFRHRHVLFKSDIWLAGPIRHLPLDWNMGPVAGPRKGMTGGNFLRQVAVFHQIVPLNRTNHCILTAKAGLDDEPDMNAPTELNFEEMLRIRLGVLKQDHRDLDHAIHALQESARGGALTLRRLKKQKLALKDQIVKIEDQLIPDIIA